MIIFTKLCKVQKYFVKKSENFDLATFKCMSSKILTTNYRSAGPANTKAGRTHRTVEPGEAEYHDTGTRPDAITT